MPKWLLSVFLFIGLWVPQARAQTIMAASCNESDVNAVINGPTHTAVNGDTIIVPTGTCTWTTPVTVSGIGITIQGADPNNTVIVDNATQIFSVSGIPVGNAFRLTNMTFQPVSQSFNATTIMSFSGTCNSSTCAQLRMDHLTFKPWPAPSSGPDGVILVSNLFGVADHNTLTGAGFMEWFGVSHSSYLAVGDFGDNSWAEPDSLGGVNNFFIENNTITGTNTRNFVFDCDGEACRVVVRFNGLTNTNMGPHGTESPGRARGVRHIEVYDNNFILNVGALGGNNLPSYVTDRGGTGMFFDNTMSMTNGSTSPAFNVGVQLDYFRTTGPGYNYWGVCDGTGPYDTDDGATNTSGSTFTAVSGSVFTDVIQNWKVNQWAPATFYYTLYDATQGWSADIISNTSNTITVSNSESGSVGDTYYIHGTTLYASGTATVANGATTLTDTSQNWTVNQWSPAGAPYSIRNITQHWGSPITSNTSNTISYESNDFSGTRPSSNNGDKYVILRATACIDQTGRGAGVLLANHAPTPVGSVNQAPDPVYIWGDSYANAPNVLTGTDTIRQVANRNYYTMLSFNQTAQTSPTSPFDGSSGTGWGTFANMPPCSSDCLMNVGYFATDRGNWNQTGSGGQGQLYVWNGSSWSLYYTPYTYPHPLTTGSLPDPPTAPAPPTSLSATVQ